MIKLVIITGTLVIGGMAAVSGISSYLAPDDLKDCAKPDPLVAKCAPADVIVAISGGDTPARTSEAVKLYKDGWAPKLLFSGAALDKSGPSNAEAMRAQALKAGVPESALLLDTRAEDTAENAQGTRQLLSSKDSRLILVTSPYHQRRASLEFGKVFGANVKIINHPTPTDRGWSSNWWMTPHGWWLAVTELTMSLVISSWR
jgi:uncharacterized SAM-binding protein YcdF (DUF218 family)